MPRAADSGEAASSSASWGTPSTNLHTDLVTKPVWPQEEYHAREAQVQCGKVLL